MNIVTNIAAVIGCISAIFGLSTAIIKPLRQWIIESFTRKSQGKKIEEKVDNLATKVDMLLQENRSIKEELAHVKANVLENEADRIRGELFDCGNRCRRGIRLHPEEMDHIRSIYHKYSKKLHENHDGEIEFNFIVEYYNNQDFPAYHTIQND